MTRHPPTRTLAGRTLAAVVVWGLAGASVTAAGGAHAWVGAMARAVEGERADLIGLQREAAGRVAAAAPTVEDRRRLAGLEARRAAGEEESLHLRVDLGAGTAALYDGPYPLRRFPVWVGPHDAAGAGVPLVPGSHRVSGVWGPHAPSSLRLADEAALAPWPGEAPATAWDVLVVGDSVMYSATPPIPAITGEALPNTVRVGEMDLAAVLPSLPPGAPVHVW